MLSALLLFVACDPGTAEVGLDTPPIEVTTPSPDPTPPTTDGATSSETPATTEPAPQDAPDFREPGPLEVLVQQQTVQTSCGMATRVARPDGAAPTALVILAHGFARSRAQVEGWADHWASWGLAVATPSLCHASFFDTDHVQNGVDLAALAEQLAPGSPVIYAGHSAGALAAWLASTQDPDAIGHVGLDLTDADDLALDAAPSLPVPSWGLLGEAEVCNADGNGASAYGAAPEALAVRIVGADHCDFESPTDWGCETFCANGTGDDALVRDVVLALSTAAVVGAAGDASALDWWTPGTRWSDLLLDAGAIQPLAW